MKMKIKLLLALFAVGIGIPTNAQSIPIDVQVNTSEQITIKYQKLSSDIDKSFGQNISSLAILDSVLHKLHSENKSVRIISNTFPNREFFQDYDLAEKRSEVFRKYLLKNYSFLKEQDVISRYRVATWYNFVEQVKKDSSIENKQELIKIMSMGTTADSISAHIKELDNGKTLKYLFDNYVPNFNSSQIKIQIISISNKSKEEKVVKQDKHIKNSTYCECKSISQTVLATSPALTAASVQKSSLKLVEPKVEMYKRPYISFKTNLLFDAVSLINAEIEVPLAKRWSIAGEVIFPWWSNTDKQRAIQTISGNVELRYWVKPNYKKREHLKGKHNPLSGWFVGVYGGGGYYDFENNAKGYQGEYFTVGISAGYVQSLTRSLSMEYSLGVGYMQTDYRHYKAEYSNIYDTWHLLRQHNGNYSWFGPTRLKVSLIWTPNFITKKTKSRW